MIVAEKETSATSLTGVFAGGDVTGESATVVHGMAAGKRAAAAINTYLTGAQAAAGPTLTGQKPLLINQAALANSSRVAAPRLPVSQRTLQREDSKTIDPEAMAGDTFRCANCGCALPHRRYATPARWAATWPMARRLAMAPRL